MLGGVPAAFAIVGLPVQIRHVTVSTGSVALVWASHAGARTEVALAIAGVAVIGIVNVAVSFAFALWLALRPVQSQTRALPRALISIGLKRWVTGRASVTPT
jgi:site-specific recombinase